MTKKKRRGRRHRTQVSAVRPPVMETAPPRTELPRRSGQVIERSSPARVSELAERHRYVLADVKRSLVIGGAMFVLPIILYVLLG